MNVKRLVLIFVLLPGIVWAGDFTTVPWEEFKSLYQNSIERRVMEKMKQDVPPSISCIEEAVYHVRINRKDAEVTVALSGRRISGKPEKLKLFKKDIIIDEIKQVVGGFLLQDADHNVVFLPEDNDPARDFQIRMTFSVPVREDSKSRNITFSIPGALKNAASLKLPQDITLVGYPGIKKSDGMYHFPSSPSIAIRFTSKKEISSVSVTEIDVFSDIRIQGRQAIVTTSFLPVQPLPPSLILKVPEDAKYVSSSLKNSWIKKLAKNKYQLSLPADIKERFTLQFAHDETDEKGLFSFFLPMIENNNGQQGGFIVRQPDDAEITLTGRHLVTDIPVRVLNAGLFNVAGTRRSFTKIAAGENFSLRLSRLQTVSTPPIVLDVTSFFTAFDDNGSVLSVLIMDIPPEAGDRLSLRAIPETDIWYVKVNGSKTKVYDNPQTENSGPDDRKWIIPLAGGKTSHVELAYIRQSEKPGLRGKLDVSLPETGLPSQHVRVGIALPERIQLLSIEGPVSPAGESAWEAPDEFVGTPYYFRRSFDRGEGMKIKVSYKEPVSG